MKKIIVVALALAACAPVKPSLKVLGQTEPITIQREGVGPLVTINPGGRWKWHRSPKEVVSEMAAAIGELAAVLQAERTQRLQCEKKAADVEAGKIKAAIAAPETPKATKAKK